jgi:hypothetical protein
MYKCKDCGRQFRGGERRDKSQVITDYVEGKQTREQLAAKYGVSSKTIGRDLEGMRGLAQALRPYPLQLCQFHQMLTVRHYLIQEPDLDASRELLELVNRITRMDKESFVREFREWYDRHKDVVDERVHDRRIKRKTPPYMRPRLRSAYLSVKRNMPLLWTFQDFPNIGLPNTNNGLEGIFSDIKTKLRVHSGLSREHRKKLIDEYLARHY